MRRPQIWLTWAIGTVGAVVAAVVAPASQSSYHFDHKAYTGAIERVRDGMSVYRASILGLRDIDSTITQVRSLRQVGLVLLWAAIPASALQPAFFLVVVLGSVLIAAPMQRIPFVSLAIGVWLAKFGVFDGVDAWLLFELWAVPLILGTCLAWLRGRDWAAAACALGVLLIRETALLLPLGFLLAARAQRRSVRPWVTCIAVEAVALGLHWWWTTDYLADEGNEAALVGTGNIQAVATMTSFLVVPELVGLLLWGIGIVLLWKSALRGAVGLAAMPLTGFLVDRPYWGLLAMPLCLLALGGLDPWPGVRSDGASPTSPPPRDPATTTAPSGPPSTPP